MTTADGTPAPTGPGSRLEAGHWMWIIPAIVIMGAMGLRLAGIDKSLWLDEVHTLRHMQAPGLIASLRSDIHPPLYFFLLKASFEVSDSVPWLRLVSLGCGVGTVAVLCAFFRGRERPAGWIAGLLLAALPGSLANSQELRQYALLLFCHGLALFFAWRVWQSPRNTGALVGLAGALAAAAATHLLTIFLLMALAPVLAWHLRHEPRTVLVRVSVALAPAAGLIAYFKLGFVVTLPPDQWWMPAVSLRKLAEIFSEASGWSTFPWLADAFERHVAHTGILVMAGAIVGTAFVLWTAWGRRQAGAAHTFLAIALLYWGLMVVYSLVSLPVIWPRTVLPGMLPFFLGLGYGIATHPDARRRAVAITAVILLAIAMTVPWLRGLAFRPNEDLRGFAHSLRAAARPNSLLVMVDDVGLGIEPYWPGYRDTRLLKVKISDPQTAADLAAALARQSPGDDAYLVYRADFYLREKQASLDAVVNQLAKALSPPGTLWEKDGYYILQFNPAK